jgi:signal transduction histidine kinase
MRARTGSAATPWATDPASRPAPSPASVRNQLLIVYGFGGAVGLHLGLLHFFLRGSVQALASFLIGSTVFASANFCLWRWVFPRLPSESPLRRILWQATVSLGTITVVSFVTTELMSELFYGFSVLNPYRGGDREFVITAQTLAYAPLVYVLVPIIPVAMMAVLGYQRYWAPMVELELRAKELSELAASAQLAALRAQIHPHFFFNSLNSIAQLVSTDPRKAEACIERLAEVFRYLTRRAERDFVPLADELEISEAYLDIERARFGDNLAIERRVEAGALRQFIPNLILQPLVENAVRHGISRKVGPGRLTIEAALVDGHLVLRVSDDGIGMSSDTLATVYERGLGLRNIRDRLARLYGVEVAPEITSAPGTGTTVVLRLPATAADPVPAQAAAPEHAPQSLPRAAPRHHAATGPAAARRARR